MRPLSPMLSRRCLLISALLSLLTAIPCRSQPESLEPAQVLARLQRTVGSPPWSGMTGYRQWGNFIYRATGEDISYDATYLRLPGRWAADFRQLDPTRSMRFVFGPRPWAASAEITADVKPAQLPFCARYDFPTLYAELVRILREKSRAPNERLLGDGEGIYARGRMSDGVEAAFVLGTRDCFPRKASLGPDKGPIPVWFFLTGEADGAATPVHIPAPGAGAFEVWFSDPIDSPESRQPRRTDYVISGGVVGSFFLQGTEPASFADPLLTRPATVPWADLVASRPVPMTGESSLYLSKAEVAAFRSRLRENPWRDWARTNALAAVWGGFAYWLPRLVPSPSSSATLAAVQVLLLAGIFVLIRRRRQMYRHSVSWRLWLSALAFWFLILLSGLASIQVKDAAGRGLLALHCAIRYSVTGNSIYASIARRYLISLPQVSERPTVSDLARANEAYSLAYDLIRPALLQESRLDVERTLITYARPLYGALRGWRANTGAVSAISAGLGMTGLATGVAEYTAEARAGMAKGLQQQIEAGLHRDGPGPGADAMDNAANLAYALKRMSAEDLYAHPAFREYVRTTLRMTSPLGTLPLFGDTSLDQSSRAVPFLLKVANHQPEETGRRCVAAYDDYWSRGRYSVRGMAKLLVRWIQPHSSFFANPYLLFHYERALRPASAAAESAVLGNGQAVVLRAGADADSVYLALNARKAPPYERNRDLLTFDLAAYGGLLLHGPGFPGAGKVFSAKPVPTASSNSITFEESGQSGTQCAGVVTSLLNQPLFDFARALGDRIYEQGQVQRDVVLVRRQKDHPPYLLLVDEIHTTDPGTKVRWYLHGSGSLSTGADPTAKWISEVFAPPSLRSTSLTLTAWLVAFSGVSSSTGGRLYYENALFNRESKTFLLAWTGSQRFCTLLLPQRSGMPEIQVQPVSGADAARIGNTDWISLGDMEAVRSIGPFRHASEYVLFRERANSFPALLMVGGLQFGSGPHWILSNKPVSLSLDGLQGGLLSTRPDTRVEFHSPTIRSGDRYLIDGTTTIAAADGLLLVALNQPGEHTLNRAP